VSPDFSIIRETATATAGQTVFDLTNTYTTGLNAIMVYQNGSRLLNADYTETDSNTVTLNTGATLNDELLFEIGVVATGTTVAAGNVSYSPAGNLSSTNVQAALTELDAEKQAALVSGTSIKTINGSTVLGSGDLTIASGITTSSDITTSTTLTNA